MLRKSIVGAAVAAIALQASAQITFFVQSGFEGHSFTTEQPVADLARFGLDDQASSAVVQSGLWEVCPDAEFHGQCVVLGPGYYASLAAMGLRKGVSSVRAAGSSADIRGSGKP